MTDVVDLVFDALGNLFTPGRTDKKLARLMAEGELLPARIYAIRYRPDSESTDDWCYGLDLQTTGGPLRVAIRQHIVKEPERAMLGATIMVRHLGGQVAIDWPATLERAGAPDPAASSFRIKQFKHPLEPGVEDRSLNRKRLQQGTRMDARIEQFEPKMVFGMPTDAYRMSVTLLDAGGERSAALDHANVPAYARALVQRGAVVPVAVDPSRPERITIDWATAAERAAA
jgi:hypothetical protein